MNRIVVFGFLFFLILSCNKQKKLIKNLTGNWTIQESVITLLHADSTDEVVESLTNCGYLVVYDDPDDPESKEKKLYDFEFINSVNDTIKNTDFLFTDEKKKRMILSNALNTAEPQNDLVFTIEKERKNKQVWSIYGVDSLIGYPSNNQNPGNADNWLVWRITLKRD